MEATSTRRGEAGGGRRLPAELEWQILETAARQGGGRGRGKLALLLLSRAHRERLEGLVYGTVCLCTLGSLRRFASLVRTDAVRARMVRRVWIGPDSCESDMVSALTPPSHTEAAYVTSMRTQAHEDVRTILRACRRLAHLALAGQLLTTRPALSYGSACQPTHLTSINPHSFLGAFSAPLFRKVTHLHIVDTTLAFEEADEIRSLAHLTHLTWSALKDYGDIHRDTNVLTRLLQRPQRHYSHPQAQAEQEHEHERDALPVAAAVDALASLQLTERLAPARPSKNDKFRRLTIETARARCDEYRRLLADSFPVALDRDAVHHHHHHEHEHEHEWDPDIHMPTIHATPVDAALLDEWDALRDLINQAGGAYSNLSLFDDGTDVDAGNALRRQRIAWENAPVW